MSDFVDFDKLPGVKERELARLGHCVVCGQPLLGSPQNSAVTFYRVTVERLAFDFGAIERRVGLGMQIGALAIVMGPDEDLARIFDGPNAAVVHEACAGQVGHVLQLVRREGAP